MFRSSIFLSSLLVFLTIVDASSLNRRTGKATLDFITRVNQGGNINIAKRDRARAQAHKTTSRLNKHRDSSFDVTNAKFFYVANVGIGSPPTNYTLLIDTGSSNTWVGASKSYTQTNTSINTGESVSVSYGSGYFSGTEWTDTVTLSSSLVIRNQSIGVANESSGFTGVDGLLGIGPVDLTQDTVNKVYEVSTVSGSLFSQGIISEEVLGVYFVPASEKDSGGTLSFGCIDGSVITGPVNFAPLTTTYPASTFWGFNQSVSYGSKTLLKTTSGIVDTGTTLILLATDAFNRYKDATGGVMDDNTGLLAITSAGYSALKTLTFNIQGVIHKLSPNAQIWPRSLNSVIGGSSDAIYLVVSDIGSDSGSGLDFVNGYTFLERYYSVFDSTNGRVGFATTVHTDATTN